jgi:hypothetical protein
MMGLFVCAAAARGQTVQGDILRGQGRYLEGAGWYNFNTARADRINVETWKAYNMEVQRLYRDYMLDRAAHTRYKRDLTNKSQEQQLRELEADQRRWRESPTLEDISSGNALNALAIDLADSSIHPSSWRTASVELPSNMTLTTLAFKIADAKKSRLQQSTVAIDRMLIKDDWPLEFRRPEIDPECKAYKKAIAFVLEKCRDSKQLQARDYDNLKASVDALKAAVDTVIPARENQRGRAREFVKRLDDATSIFMGYQFAEQLIRDVSTHKATDVATLLSFMRDYQLMFADPGDSPEVISLYGKLYGLLRQQKEALGIRDAKPPLNTTQSDPRPDKKGPFVVSTLRKIDGDPRTKQARTGKIRLFSNGHINAPDGAGTWWIRNGVITLRWPNRSAPGGAWLDAMRIAADSRSARGKNQVGTSISVELLDGSLLKR